MHIIQFWRIFWAKRLLIAATTVFCLLGGFAVGKLLPPRYESHARVMLGLLGPGQARGGQQSRRGQRGCGRGGQAQAGASGAFHRSSSSDERSSRTGT